MQDDSQNKIMSHATTFCSTNTNLQYMVWYIADETETYVIQYRNVLIFFFSFLINYNTWTCELTEPEYWPDMTAIIVKWV